MVGGKRYLIPIKDNNPWDIAVIRYQVNWDILKTELGIEPPNPLEPLSLRRTSLKEIGK